MSDSLLRHFADRNDFHVGKLDLPVNMKTVFLLKPFLWELHFCCRLSHVPHDYSPACGFTRDGKSDIMFRFMCGGRHSASLGPHVLGLKGFSLPPNLFLGFL